MKIQHLLIFLFLMASAFADAPVNVTVLSFKVDLDQFHVSSVIRSFTGTCKSELSRCPGIRVLERENLADITSEIALGSTGLLKDPSAIDSLKLEGVDYVIGGEISQASSQRQRVIVFIREVRTARIVSEKITGNIELYPEAAAKMLSHNIACLLTGSGAPVEKKIMTNKVGVTAFAIGITGLVAGAALRYFGEKEYTKSYGKQDMPLSEFDSRFKRAQGLTSGGEIVIGASSVALGVGITIIFSKRLDRTISRE